MRKIFLTMALLLSATAFAQESSRMTIQRGNGVASAPDGVWMFGSVLGGNFDTIDNQPSLGIRQYGVKASVQNYGMKMANEIGLAYERFENNSTDFKVDTAVLEGLAGFRLGDSWYVGPMANTTLGHARDLGATDDTSALFVGAGLYKNWAVTNDNILRVGVKALVDANIPSATVGSGAIEIQYGAAPVRPATYGLR